MLEAFIAFFTPHSCLGCNRQGTLLCANCREHIPEVPLRCYRCQVIGVDGRTCTSCCRVTSLHTVQVATHYDGAAKDIVWHLKFAPAPAAAQPMGSLMADRFVFNNSAVFVHVPAATSRVRRRGYDHAALLRQELSQRTGIRSRRWLERQGQTRQVGASRAERRRHLAAAFAVKRTPQIKGARIVLVDAVVFAQP